MEKEASLETGTDTPCPPVRRTGKLSAADPKAPTGKTLPEDPGAPHRQAGLRGPRSTPLAGGTPRISRLRPVASGRLPATGDAEVPLETLDAVEALGSTGADRG